MSTADLQLRPGTPHDDVVIARLFRQMWLDNDVAADRIVDDAAERVTAFLDDGRRRHGLQTVLAVDGGDVVGGAVCQEFAGLYPNILKDEQRKYGYIWGVYVDENARKQGLGRRLTQHCVDTLTAMGCSHAILHAAPMGVNVYKAMGFVPNNEMRLVLGA